MTDPRIIKLATEYLDQCSAANEPATLVGMHWYIDSRDRTLPILEEVNEMLKQRSAIRIERVNSLVVFGPNGSDRTITAEDMKRAEKQYRKEFAAALRGSKK